MMGLVFAALMTVQVVQPAATEDPVVCAVDTAAQMARPWAQFEFDTEAPGGPMALAGKGCHRAAAQVSRDYLARGPLLSGREQAITQLHMARNLAYAGDEAAAAQAAASARRSDQRATAEAPLDWNTYVQGLYGFLTRDRALLDESLERLRVSTNAGDAGNGRNLGALATCFDKSYTEAMTEKACWAPAAEVD